MPTPAAPISSDQLLNELRSRPYGDVVQDHLLAGEPVVFASKPELYPTLKAHIAKTAGVDQAGIRIVGSAKLGYSMSPNSFGRAFSDSSDVDVVVVDPALFDKIWSLLLDWRYPWHLRKWEDKDLNWGVARLESFICGHCTPDKITYDGIWGKRLLRPLRNVSTQWFNAFKSLGQNTDFANRNFNGRLYRSWEHVVRYHAHSFGELVQTTNSTTRRTR